jgi:type III secretory pathway component EscR
LLGLGMSQRTKSFLIIALSVIITFFVTAHFVRHSMLNALKIKFVEMDAFNDVYRVEAYDTLESFLKKGCNKEALEFIKIQQTLLLSGLKQHMTWGDAVRESVVARNQEIANRANESPSRQDAFVIPTCE